MALLAIGSGLSDRRDRRPHHRRRRRALGRHRDRVRGGRRRAQAGSRRPPPASPAFSCWRQDFESSVRRYYFQRGHPDVSVRLIANPSIPIDGVETILVHADIDPGPAVTLGTVRFEERTRESVLRPLVRLKPGAPLDPTVLEDGQFAISHLGVFNSVELSQDPETGGVRDAVYRLREGRRTEASVLLAVRPPGRGPHALHGRRPYPANTHTN